MLANRGNRTGQEPDRWGDRGDIAGSARRRARAHARAIHNNSGQFPPDETAIRLDAGYRGCGMCAAIVGGEAAGRLAGSIRQEKRGYQDDSDSCTTKHAYAHETSLALPFLRARVMRVTSAFNEYLGGPPLSVRDTIRRRLSRPESTVRSQLKAAGAARMVCE